MIYIVSILFIGLVEYRLLQQKYYLVSNFIFPSIIVLVCILILYKKIKLFKIVSFFFINFLIVILLEYFLLGINREVVSFCMIYLIVAYIFSVDSFK